MTFRPINACSSSLTIKLQLDDFTVVLSYNRPTMHCHDNVKSDNTEVTLSPHDNVD